MKIGLFNGEATCEKTYRDVYSELDFVLIVATFDGENLELHRNGVSQVWPLAQFFSVSFS